MKYLLIVMDLLNHRLIFFPETSWKFPCAPLYLFTTPNPSNFFNTVLLCSISKVLYICRLRSTTSLSMHTTAVGRRMNTEIRRADRDERRNRFYLVIDDILTLIGQFLGHQSSSEPMPSGRPVTVRESVYELKIDNERLRRK